MKSISLYIILTAVLVACQEKIATEKIQFINAQEKEIALTAIDEFLTKQMDSLNIPGLSIAIINDAEVVYHQAIGVSSIVTQEPIDDNSIFESASITKPVFAYFALKMAERGLIDLDRPLYFYLEDIDMAVDDRYKNVTARMVLSHTTGFPNWRWFDPAPAEMEVERGDFYMKADPGTFTYSGEAYQYLARVLAHNNFINMFELADLFRDQVTAPIGMDHAYIVWDDFLYDNKVIGHKDNEAEDRNWGTGLPHQHSKILGAAGGLNTEAKSYAQFLIALMHEEGLYLDSFNEMFSEQVVLPSDHRFRLKNNTKAWGLGLAIEEDGENKYYKHGGNNGGFMSRFLIDKKSNNGYVYFVNCDKGKEFNAALRKLIME